MRRVSLGDLQPGTKLTRPVYGASGALLLSRGKSVTSQFLESLDSWGIPSVYVDDGAALASLIPENVRTTYNEALGRVSVAMEKLRRGVEVPIAEVGAGLAEFVLELATEPGVFGADERSDAVSEVGGGMDFARSQFPGWRPPGPGTTDQRDNRER